MMALLVLVLQSCMNSGSTLTSTFHPGYLTTGSGEITTDSDWSSTLELGMPLPFAFAFVIESLDFSPSMTCYALKVLG